MLLNIPSNTTNVAARIFEVSNMFFWSRWPTVRRGLGHPFGRTVFRRFPKPVTNKVSELLKDLFGEPFRETHLTIDVSTFLRRRTNGSRSGSRISKTGSLYSYGCCGNDKNCDLHAEAERALKKRMLLCPKCLQTHASLSDVIHIHSCTLSFFHFL